MPSERPGAVTEHLIEWDDEKVSRLWNYYARTPPYNDFYFSKFYGDRMLEQTHLPRGERLRVLDFGCGPGFIWEHLVRMGTRWEYCGLDFSADAVRAVRDKAGAHPQFGGATHVTTLPSDLPATAFDAVFLFEVIEHLKDEYLEQTLREAARLLKTGGVLVISTPNDEDLSLCTKLCPECGAIFHEWQHVRSWSVSTLQTHVQRYGFEMRKARALDFSARGVVGRFARWGRRFVLKRNADPHLIAVFQKR